MTELFDIMNKSLNKISCLQWQNFVLDGSLLLSSIVGCSEKVVRNNAGASLPSRQMIYMYSHVISKKKSETLSYVLLPGHSCYSLKNNKAVLIICLYEVIHEAQMRNEDTRAKNTEQSTGAYFRLNCCNRVSYQFS